MQGVRGGQVPINAETVHVEFQVSDYDLLGTSRNLVSDERFNGHCARHRLRVVG